MKRLIDQIGCVEHIKGLSPMLLRLLRRWGLRATYIHLTKLARDSTQTCSTWTGVALIRRLVTTYTPKVLLLLEVSSHRRA